VGNKQYAYGAYADPAVNNGVFGMAPAVAGVTTVALLSDWASATAESIQIGALVGQQDYSIHLGDTYYIGNAKEIADNFSHVDGAAWPYGRHGSFALLGNHEMYSSGKPFFEELLPHMGSYADGKVRQQQQASYFSLENEHWRIIGLDTGYNSLKGLLGLRANTGLRLTDQQMEWLRETVRPSDDKRGIIFLSHHPCFSAFEKDEFQAIIPQIAPLLGKRNVLWFWGHEHRLSFYGYNVLGDGGCFARCIGHGGMPVETGEFRLKGSAPTDKANRNLVLYDERVRKTIGGNIGLGHNGYVILELRAAELVVKYFDDSFVDAHGARSPIVEERWTVDLSTGVLAGKSIIDHTVLRPGAASQLSFCQDIAAVVHQITTYRRPNDDR
jgi:Calcineurin-like phosphoesterase